MVTTTVFITTSYEGIHCYPKAPEEVAYLRVPHRHTFGVRVEIEVFSNDRELEFIMLKHRINKWIQSHFDSNGVWQMGSMSCEQVASNILEMLRNTLARPSERSIDVSVDEDGENGVSVCQFSDVECERDWLDV